jgi:hypothetical protein
MMKVHFAKCSRMPGWTWWLRIAYGGPHGRAGRGATFAGGWPWTEEAEKVSVAERLQSDGEQTVQEEEKLEGTMTGEGRKSPSSGRLRAR